MCLEHFIYNAPRASSLADLHRQFQDALAGIGFDNWAYQAIGPAHETETRPHIVASYPQQWVERYIEKGYHRLDPVITRGSKLMLPFSWGSLKALTTTGKEVSDFFHEATEFGLPDGFGLSIQGGNHAHAMISASTRQNRRDIDHILSDSGRDIHLASLVFHTIARDLLGMEKKQNPFPALTPREVECLTWAMSGKSAWDIGKILNISEAAVRFHFANVREKLDVSTIREAIVRAYMNGILRP